MAWNREKASPPSKQAVVNAPKLRRMMTEAETLLWGILRTEVHLPAGTHFRRQMPIGSYVVDFVSVKLRLIVEVDGPVHNDAKQIEYDARRDEYLRGEGFTVLRFTNDEVMLGRSAVLNSVTAALAAATPIRPLTRTPSPQGGRLELNP